MSTNQSDIPAGKYDCWIIVPQDGDGIPRHDITTDRTGALAIDVPLAVAAVGSDSPFASVSKEMCIDAEQPARGGVETTPYGFMVLELSALGADLSAIDDAVINGLSSDDQKMIFPGRPKVATVEVSYKAGNKGGSFMNLRVSAKREVTDENKARAIEAAKARRAANKPQGNPFAPRSPAGAPVAPPARRPPATT